MKNVRNILWLCCFVTMALICVIWSLIPTLQAWPLARVALFFSAGCMMLGLVFSFPTISDRSAYRLIIVAAVLLRILLWTAPVSDDVNRYLWEGRLVTLGENPYVATADDPRWISYRDEVWEAMNHRDLPTAYPPGIQWILAGTTALWENVYAFKILALLGDGACLFLLLALVRLKSAPLRWVGFYAFNPVVLISFAAEAHFDSLMVAAMLAALLAALQEKRSAWAWLGVAIQLKIICVVLLPLLLTRQLWKGAWWLVPILILPTLPLLSGLTEWGNGVSLFAVKGSFNAPLYSLMTFFGIAQARVLALFIFVVTSGFIVIRRWQGMDLIVAARWLLGALLVCSPVVHFWYFTWILPLVVLRPSFAWVTASLTMSAYFIAWWTQANAGWWGFSHGVTGLIWAPWLFAWLVQNRVSAMRLYSPIPTRIAVVIPTINQVNLNLFENQFEGSTEIVVVACTAQENLLENPFNIIHARRGRGNQIAAGIAATSAPWILIAHDDIQPREGWEKDLEEAISQHPDAVMLLFGQRFDRSSIGLVFLEILNEMRAVFTGIGFGDQTMVTRRDAIQRCGGFPVQPLMEDVEVSLRLIHCGPVIYLAKEWTVSAKKWDVGKSGHFLSRMKMIMHLCVSYCLVHIIKPRATASLSERMYQKYYGTKS